MTRRPAAPVAARRSRPPGAARPASGAPPLPGGGRASSGASRRPAPAARPRGPRPAVTAPRARALRVGVLCALAVVCLVSVLAPLSAYVRQQADLAALTDEVAGSRAEVERLRAEAARWEDPAYVSAQARGRLHYVLPGETGYAVLDAADAGAADAGAPAPGATGAPAAAGGPGEPVPGAAWYASLWGSVETAGRS